MKFKELQLIKKTVADHNRMHGEKSFRLKVKAEKREDGENNYDALLFGLRDNKPRTVIIGVRLLLNDLKESNISWYINLEEIKGEVVPCIRLY